MIKVKKLQSPFKKILYAEDSETEFMFFRAALRWSGHPVKLLAAADGDKAMHMLDDSNGNKPDIIFLDISMPNKDGKQCLAEIKKNAHLSNVPVVMLSISSDKEEIEDAYSKGANLYVTKPFDFDSEVKLLKKIFSLDWKDYQPQPPREKFVLSVDDI